mgnify:CR=1 FL=1
MLEDLYNHGQRIAAILHKLKDCEDLGPEVIDSVEGLKDNLIEEFVEFAETVADRSDATPPVIEPPF